MDYHTKVEQTYRSTLSALAGAGLRAEMIETGGGCKAIWIDGFVLRRFDGEHTGIMLTAGGPLSDERDTDTDWEGGVYNRDGIQVGSLMFFGLKDTPTADRELASEVAMMAEVIR